MDSATEKTMLARKRGKNKDPRGSENDRDPMRRSTRICARDNERAFDEGSSWIVAFGKREHHRVRAIGGLHTPPEQFVF